MGRRERSKHKRSTIKSGADSSAEPILAVRSQAASFGWVAAAGVFAEGCVLALLEGDTRLVLAIVIGCLTGSMALVWGILLWLNRWLHREAQTLLHGSWKARWVVPDSEWQEFVNRERRRYAWVLPGVSVVGALMGLFVGSVLYSDGNLIDGRLWLTFLLPVLAGTAIGGGIGAFFQHISGLQFKLAAKHPGLVLFGDDGYYMPGEYRPWRSFGQFLSRAEVSKTENGAAPRLAMTFKVKTKHGYSDVHAFAPIPAGREADAERIVEWLNGRFYRA